MYITRSELLNITDANAEVSLDSPVATPRKVSEEPSPSQQNKMPDVTVIPATAPATMEPTPPQQLFAGDSNTDTYEVTDNDSKSKEEVCLNGSHCVFSQGT